MGTEKHVLINFLIFVRLFTLCMSNLCNYIENGVRYNNSYSKNVSIFFFVPILFRVNQTACHNRRINVIFM